VSIHGAVLVALFLVVNEQFICCLLRTAGVGVFNAKFDIVISL
jgi:hypothetical protein